MTDAFDPTTVPPFPVVTLDLRDDDSVAVNGRPIDIGPDESPRDAGIRAVAAIATAQGLGAVRTRATSPDGLHLMVVTDQGRPYAIDNPDEPATATPRRNSQRRAAKIVLGAAGVAVIVLGGGITAFAIGAHHPAPVATAAPTPPNAGAALPVLSPPGYSETAAWAVKVAKNTTPVLIDAHRIAAVGDDGNLRIIDTHTGRTTWHGSGAPTGTATLAYTHVEGRPVLASATARSITLWPIDTTGSAKTKGTAVSTGSQATVTYLGSAPLIDLGDQTVALLTSKGVVRKDVPVTATAVAASQNSFVAASADHIWRIPVSGKTTTTTMPKPKGATGQPDLISAANESTLIVLWPTKDQSTDIATLVDADQGTILASAQVDANTADSRAVPVQSATGTTLALGSLFVDYGNSPKLVDVQDFNPTVVDGDTVYGLEGSTPVAATLTGTAFKIQQFSDIDTNDRTTPSAVTGGQAFVVADKVENTYLYALPRSTETGQ